VTVPVGVFGGFADADAVLVGVSAPHALSRPPRGPAASRLPAARQTN